VSFIWPINRTGFPALPATGSPPTAEFIKALTERNAAENLAIRILHALSGRQFGIAEHLVRPCPPRRSWGRGDVGSYLLSWEGDGWATWSCGCVGGCNRSSPRAVHLPGPVHAITEVKIAGVVQAPNGYRVEENVLYRVASNWPYQDLGRPLGEAHTWSVKYERGIPVPPEGAALAGLLAREFLAALTDSGECRLPRTVQIASRQGITYRAYDPAAIYAAGKTGLPEVDIWLASVNPNHLSEAPSVL